MNIGEQGVQLKSMTSVEAMESWILWKGTGPENMRTVWSQPAELPGRAVAEKGDRATNQTVHSKSSRLWQQVAASEEDDFPAASSRLSLVCQLN